MEQKFIGTISSLATKFAIEYGLGLSTLKELAKRRARYHANYARH